MTRISSTTVGFIGLGIMREATARNLRKAGFSLVVDDRRPEAAAALIGADALWAGSPREVAERSDVIFTCLPSLTAIETVALGEDPPAPTDTKRGQNT